MTQEATKIAVNHDLKEPPKFSVVYINDDVTTVVFVVETLMLIFGHNFESAEDLAQEIHNSGAGVAAVLPYEMAEHKTLEVIKLAREQNFPLEVRVEPSI